MSCQGFVQALLKCSFLTRATSKIANVRHITFPYSTFHELRRLLQLLVFMHTGLENWQLIGGRTSCERRQTFGWSKWHQCCRRRKPEKKKQSRWWFQIFFIFTLVGEDSHFDWYFSNGLKPPTSSCLNVRDRHVPSLLQCIQDIQVKQILHVTTCGGASEDLSEVASFAFAFRTPPGCQLCPTQAWFWSGWSVGL